MLLLGKVVNIENKLSSGSSREDVLFNSVVISAHGSFLYPELQDMQNRSYYYLIKMRPDFKSTNPNKSTAVANHIEVFSLQ